MDINKRVVIPGKMISTTATHVYFPSVIPKEKDKLEVFWVEQLLCKLPCFSEKKYSVLSNEDDSEGNHDVIINFYEDKVKKQEGVQVTELTRELKRSLTPRRDNYLKKIIEELYKKNISSAKKVIVGINFPKLELNSGKPRLPKPKKIAELIDNNLNNKPLEENDFIKITVSSMNSTSFCIPHINNIGINVSFDELPRTFEMYIQAVDCIISKKSKSKSSSLVIWSTSLEKDKHWVMNELVNYMKIKFENTHFLNVYLIESMDGEGWFQANLSINIIKADGKICTLKKIN